jgi:hypothetical protein
MEENDADKISPKLFELMLESAMEKGNRLIWAMSVLQWSLMACSQNIDNLVFKSFTMGSDSVRVKTNMNSSGHKTTSKNCYANPHNVRFACSPHLLCTSAK